MASSNGRRKKKEAEMERERERGLVSRGKTNQGELKTEVGL